MEDSQLFRLAIRGGFATAICLSFTIFKITAPYGRHYAGSPLISSWLGRVSRLLPPRAGWVVMECPALILPPLLFLAGRHAGEPLARFLLSLFLVHYAHRVLIFPLRIRPSARNMPLSVILSGFLFNLYNGYIQARSLSEYAPPGPSPSPFLPPHIRVAIGTAFFFMGMWINIWADSVLISLRSKAAGKEDDNSVKVNGNSDGKTDRGSSETYRIPRGGLYEYVSCPNYFGEIIEWTAWAFMTWSPAGLVFLLLTLSNLVPRALAHHRWYAAHFTHYPASRRALIPFIL